MSQPAHADIGSEPDPCLPFANERAFLAWELAGFALICGGLAAAQALHFGLGSIRLVVAGPPIALGGLIAIASYRRWHINERATRLGKPLDDSPLPAMLILGIVSLAAILSLLALLTTVTGTVERTTAQPCVSAWGTSPGCSPRGANSFDALVPSPALRPPGRAARARSRARAGRSARGHVALDQRPVGRVRRGVGPYRPGLAAGQDGNAAESTRPT